jgi:alanine dehydrogenase
MNIGILAEGKVPVDNRTPLTPTHCRAIVNENPGLPLVVQKSQERCYSDQEYENAGIPIVDTLEQCDILLGVKEVPISQLIPNKTYLFFSHTIKKQPYNRELLQALLEKKITMIDYECLTNEQGQRVIAFGRWAGIVGAHSGLWTFGKRQGRYELPRAKDVNDYSSLKSVYEHFKMSPAKIAVTGGGRVAQGVWEVMELAGIRQVDPYEFLSIDSLKEPIYSRLFVHDLYRHKEGHEFDLPAFFQSPEKFESRFLPFARQTDLMINAIYWDPRAPVYFTKEELQKPDFKITTIADITCDIEGSIPATLKATTIDEPVMGYDRRRGVEVEPYQENVLDIMSVDNLPNELPRDSSAEFGSALKNFVIPALQGDDSAMIEKATICSEGKLTSRFEYLTDFALGKE